MSEENKKILVLLDKTTSEILSRIILLNGLKTDEASKLAVEYIKSLSSLATLRNSYTNKTSI